MTPEVQEVFKLFENYLEAFMSTKYSMLSNGQSTFHADDLNLKLRRDELIEKLESGGEK